MKKYFKNNYLVFLFVALTPLVGQAADTTVPATQRFSPEARQARIEQCRGDPEKCRAEMQARREQWCKDNAERCKEIQARLEKRAAQCQADPEKCRAQRQARFEQRFKHVDTDGNGMISRAEAEKAMPHFARHFDAIDINRDGQISKEELTQARQVRHERRRQHKEPSKI